MIELVFLALLNRLMNWGLTPLIATRTVAADAGTLHHFLSEPGNQLRLLRKVPCGLDVHVQPWAKGRVVAVEIMRGRRTALWATWILSAGRGTTEVDLAVQFETRGLATRLALVLGGRRCSRAGSTTHWRDLPRSALALPRTSCPCPRPRPFRRP